MPIYGRTLVSKGDTILIEREQNGWLIKEPVSSKVDAFAVNTYLQYYAGIIEIMVVEEVPPDLSRFGLESPELEVTLKMNHNLSPVNIMIGNKNPNGTCCYAKKKSLPQVLLVGSGCKNELTRNMAFFSRHELD